MLSDGSTFNELRLQEKGNQRKGQLHFPPCPQGHKEAKIIIAAIVTLTFFFFACLSCAGIVVSALCKLAHLISRRMRYAVMTVPNSQLRKLRY